MLLFDMHQVVRCVSFCLFLLLPLLLFFFFLMRPRPPISTLFPYTTLFRSARPLPRLPGPAGRSRGRAPEIVQDRKSTRLNSSHLGISYAVFCLKKKKKLSHLSHSTLPASTYALQHRTPYPAAIATACRSIR